MPCCITVAMYECVCTETTTYANVHALLHQVNNATARVMTKKTAVAPPIPNGKTSIYDALYAGRVTWALQ